MMYYSLIASTLLHSLWQGLLAMLVLWVIQRVIPTSAATLRYRLQVLLLGLFLVGVGVTAGLNLPALSAPEVQGVEVTPAVMELMLTPAAEVSGISWKYLLVNGWFAGVFLFGLRLLAGIWQVERLRASALPAPVFWEELLHKMDAALTSRVRIRLSSHISSPVVLGVVAPIILIPAGLVSGLTTAELEAVLLHEITHIRRRDYLVNIIQVLAETLFFFNPFVWILSRSIRQEREYCCDDAVVRHVDPLVYAETLAKMQILAKNPVLSLGLGKSRFEILNRIKRMFEPQKHHWKSKLVPVALLLIGLFCISWIGVNVPAVPSPDNAALAIAAPEDTTKKPRVKVYTRKSITTYDAQGKPTTRIVESFEDDGDKTANRADTIEIEDDVEIIRLPSRVEEVRVFRTPGFPQEVELDLVEPVELEELAELEALNHLEHFEPRFDFQFDFNFPKDSLNPDWLKFREEFTARFKDRFSGFYKKNSKELDQLMRELEQVFPEDEMDRIDRMAEVKREIEIRQRDIDRMTREIERIQRQRFNERYRDQAERQREQIERQRHQIERQREQAERQQERATRFKVQAEELRVNAEAMKKKMEAFQAELQKELVKDGYLKSGEKITSLEMSEDEFKVNGTAIRQEHLPKYRELNKRFFEGGSIRLNLNDDKSEKN